MPAPEPEPTESEAIEALCRQWDDLHVIATACEELPALERMIAAVRDDHGTAAALVELDELLRRCGLSAGLGVRAGWRWSGIGLPDLDGHPVEEAWVCPTRRCARVELGDTDTAPTCGLSGQSLHAVRV